ncbi:prolyl oligopeptidase family serine peptidase [Halorussus ruber]|uniref:prolyl oligopeptidase family serine peptidase n=1 Tax=Halorussus ruber TaxID=1126238 RepID=UPI0010924625|nr:prolyl oligopeptidase family serine peptidase [Halorussus ruber]
MSPTSEESSDPPETRREAVTEEVRGTEVADPYRWLEGDGEAVRAWTAAQNEYADAHLDTPTRERLRSKLADLADVAEYGPVEVAGGRYFQTVRRPGDDHARLVVRESPEGEETLLVDPNRWPGNGGDGNSEDAPPKSMPWFLPSHDGEFVAYGVTEGGDEQVDIRVASVPGGEKTVGQEEDVQEVAVRADCGRVSRGFVGFDAVSPGMVAWDGESRGLYYVATGCASDGGGEGEAEETEGTADSQADKEIRYWRFDGTEAVLLEHDDSQVWPLVRTDPESGTLAVALHDVSGTDWYVRVEDDIESELRPVIEDSDAETFAVFHDGTVLLQTDHEAPRKRVLACSLDRFRAGDLSLAECETVLPEREGVLQSFAVTPDHVVAHYLEDAHSRLAVYERGHSENSYCRDITLPDYASVSGLRSNDAAEEIFYRVESFHHPPTLVRANPSVDDRNPAAGNRQELERIDVDVPENLVVRQTFAESADGTEVPVFVCHREDATLDGDNPAVLYGYGGFRSSRPPSFDRYRVPFLADGGVYAQVCARGGQEYGEEWHEAGMLADKQRTFEDFLAAGELLCEEGYTNPDRLAVSGRSNGGLSVGAVVTQRPDRWAAARCAVPLLDMLRFHRLGMGASWTGEYGNPEESEAFEYLRDYSPYHNVEAGVEYPPVLFTTAMDDTRVHPAHARKMAAQMQAEGEGGPFLLRTETDTGHGVGRTASSAVVEEVEKWTFFYECLGMGEARKTSSDNEREKGQDRCGENDHEDFC